MGKVIEQKTQEIIAQLKEIRAEKGYSCQKVCDLVEASGGYVSLTTIKRVFAEGSEKQNFRYNETIKPIAIALLGINDAPQESHGQSAVDHEIAALKTVISIKEQINQDQRAENQRMAEESDRKHQHIIALTEQVSESLRQIRRKDRLIVVLSMSLIALLTLICGVLVYDVSRLDTGFVRGFSGSAPLALVGIAAALVCVLAVCVTLAKSRRRK